MDNLLIAARSALLDALTALNDHRDRVVVGAQAVYLRSGQADVAIAEFTKDSDLVLDPRGLAEEPLLQDAMRKAGFLPGLSSSRPKSWPTTNTRSPNSKRSPRPIPTAWTA